MNEHKVIGASDRNLKALKMALTIKGATTNAGLVKPTMKLKQDQNVNVDLNFPFKLKTIKNESGSFLEILPGRINISTFYSTRIHVDFTGDNKINLNVLNEDKTYVVMMFIDYLGAGEYRTQICFADASSTIQICPWSRGLFNIGLGEIERKTVENVTYYNVKNQRIYSDISLSYASFEHPFSVTARLKNNIHGQVISSLTLTDYILNIAGGLVLKPDSITQLEATTSPLKGVNTYVVLNVWADKDPTITISDKSDLYFDEAGNYFYRIAYVLFGENSFEIQQFIFDTLTLGSDTYKVKTFAGDPEPSYLYPKFKFDQEAGEDNYPISGYERTYIGGCIDKQLLRTEGDTDIYAYFVKPAFSYKSIPGYESGKDNLALTVDGGELKWSEISGGVAASGDLSLSGSIERVFGLSDTVDEDGKPTKTLYIKTEDSDDYTGYFSWLGLGENGDLDYWNYNVNDFTGIESIQCLDNETGEPFALPTEPYDENEVFVLAGDDDAGLYWIPLYESITGEMNKVAINELDEMPDFLERKIAIDDSLKDFIEIYVSEEGTTLMIGAKEFGSGIITLENGVIKTLTAPTTGQHVLTVNEGIFKWEPVGECGGGTTNNEDESGE